MRTVRTMFAAMLMAMACFLQQASATSFTTDQGDAWSVPGESGWGYLNAQVGSVKPATFNFLRRKSPQIHFQLDSSRTATRLQDAPIPAMR
jgi:hypothetical protein